MAICTIDNFSYIKIVPEKSFVADNGKLYVYLLGFECIDARLLDKERTPLIKKFISNLKAYLDQADLMISDDERSYYNFIINNWQYIFWSCARKKERLHHQYFSMGLNLNFDTINQTLTNLGFNWEWWHTPIIYTDAILFDCSLIEVDTFDIELIYQKIKEYYSLIYGWEMRDC